MSSEVKVIRGQVRQAVKELLQDILLEQLSEDIYNKVKKLVSERLDEVQAYVKETQDHINTRNKEVLKFLLENSVEGEKIKQALNQE